MMSCNGIWWCVVPYDATQVREPVDRLLASVAGLPRHTDAVDAGAAAAATMAHAEQRCTALLAQVVYIYYCIITA